MRTMRSMSAGFGGTALTAATNSSRSFDSSGFQRFSKPSVEDGLPDKSAPQTLPTWCPGKISISSGNERSFAQRLVELRGHLGFAPQQVGPSDCSYE